MASRRTNFWKASGDEFNWRFDRAGQREPLVNTKKKDYREMTLLPLLAELSGSLNVGLAALGSAIGVGFIGMKAAEATGRNPGAAGDIRTQAIIFAALAEGVLFIAIFLGKAGN
ncbi:MAG: ATP synthase subunit c [Verrucomicrobia subdivision 3 bacterium]|nr:ATP synthase subunit c [Limisphaerales bacterium]MCS1415461.1 ATP synthase subunit c [Limisphaerales bacterium]